MGSAKTAIVSLRDFGDDEAWRGRVLPQIIDVAGVGHKACLG